MMMRYATRCSRRALHSTSNLKRASSSNGSSKRPSAPTRGLLAMYGSLLEKYPLATKVSSAGVIMGAGDAASQCLTNESIKDFDIARTTRFTIIGAALVAPVLHHWYRLLNTLFPGTAPKAILKRLALDQLGFAPTFIPAFWVTLHALEGDLSMKKISTLMREQYRTTLIGNWVIWVPAQIINFRFIPMNYQVLFSNCTGFFWNIFLSYQTFRRKHDQHHDHSSGLY